VFTEYRDTLQYVADTIRAADGISIIHGGLDEAERLRARAAFTRGECRVLLATDAAGEGLNLHHRCRLVINLELPWNPTRLEQRIGRVDRLGQMRRVHAINLFAPGTSEEDVLKRLVNRLARARHAVGHLNDPLGAVDDLMGVMLEHEGAADEITPEKVAQLDLRDCGVIETKRLNAVRRVALDPSEADQETAQITTFRRAELGGLVRSSSLICLVRARLVSGDGELVEHLLVPLVTPFSVPAPIGRAIPRPKILWATVRRAIEAVEAELQTRTLAIAHERRRNISADYQTAVEARRVKELALIRTIETDAQIDSHLQPGLFDTRFLRDQTAALRSRAVSLGDEVVRVRQIDRSYELVIAEPAELALVLVVA
jgi:Helicase conserved C-terminal domain